MASAFAETGGDSEEAMDPSSRRPPPQPLTVNGDRPSVSVDGESFSPSKLSCNDPETLQEKVCNGNDEIHDTYKTQMLI